MYLGLYQPADVVEEQGEDYFIAAHPRPRARAPGLLQVVLGGRHELVRLQNPEVTSQRRSSDPRQDAKPSRRSRLANGLRDLAG
jgi:hypothetical protein